MLGWLIKRSAHLRDAHPVAKCSVFRCGAGMWGPLDVGAVGLGARALGRHTRLRNLLPERDCLSLKADCKKLSL